MKLTSEIIKNEACKAGFNPDEYYEKISKFIEDRKGHDFRYALASHKLNNLGFKNEDNFEKSLIETVNSFRRKQS